MSKQIDQDKMKANSDKTLVTIISLKQLLFIFDWFTGGVQ